jgi:mono/diheme cytochrome c family protein
MLRLVDRGLMVLSWVAAALVVVLLFAGPSLIGAKKSQAQQGSGQGSTQTSGGNGQTSGQTSPQNSGQAVGAAVFKSAGCGSCHTLKAADASGTVGPNLDQLQPSADAVSQIVRSGGGVMPSFSSRLSDAQIAAVASYVSSVAGR